MSPIAPLAQTRTLVFLAYPQMGLLDLTGAQTVFWAATKAMAERGLPGYVMHTASLAGGLMQTAEGLSVDTVALGLLADTPIDTLIVPGAPAIQQAMAANTELVEWLRIASASAGRTASVCSGTFLLAMAACSTAAAPPPTGPCATCSSTASRPSWWTWTRSLSSRAMCGPRPA